MGTPNEQAVASPPIAKLHRDLLWQIFALNADIEVVYLLIEVYGIKNMVRLSPLTTARHTSQVCVSWRQLVISSSSLWGNIIDLEFLNQKSDIWRNEVLLRTGSEDLSIRGDIVYDDNAPGVAEFFELLLKNHWTRIMRVNVTVDIRSRRWPDDVWSTLERPAPALQSFSI